MRFISRLSFLLFAAVLSIFVITNINFIQFKNKIHSEIQVSQETAEVIYNHYVAMKNLEAYTELYPVIRIASTVSFDGIPPQTYMTATGFSVYYDKKEGSSYILTNAHFCDEVINLNAIGVPNITMYDTAIDETIPDWAAYGELEILDSDASDDLCLMKTEEYVPPVKFAKDHKHNIYDKIRIVGAPQGSFPIVLDGYLTSYVKRLHLPFTDMQDSGSDILFISTMIQPGSSGSPVYNKNGRVIGIVFAGIHEGYGTMAISAEDIKIWLEERGYKYRE